MGGALVIFGLVVSASGLDWQETVTSWVRTSSPVSSLLAKGPTALTATEQIRTQGLNCRNLHKTGRKFALSGLSGEHAPFVTEILTEHIRQSTTDAGLLYLV